MGQAVVGIAVFLNADTIAPPPDTSDEARPQAPRPAQRTEQLPVPSLGDITQLALQTPDAPEARSPRPDMPKAAQVPAALAAPPAPLPAAVADMQVPRSETDPVPSLSGPAAALVTIADEDNAPLLPEPDQAWQAEVEPPLPVVAPAISLTPLPVLPSAPQEAITAFTPPPIPASNDPAIPRESKTDSLPRPAFASAPVLAPEPAAATPETVVQPNIAKTVQPVEAARAPVPYPSMAHAMPQPAFGHAAAPTDASSAMQDAVQSAFTDDDELILQLELPGDTAGDMIEAYGTRAGVYLPLGALARYLDLAVTVSDGGNYAGGWLLDQQKTLALNLRQGTLAVAGQDIPLAKGDAQAFQGELYLRAERFADILPLALKVDQRAQTLTVRTLTPFPFEQRLARDQSRTRLTTGTSQAQRWPREDTPWSALSFPLADVEVRAMSDSVLGTRTESDTRFAGDLAFMTARVFASTSTKYGVTAARIELGRRDPDADLLGPLRATEYEMGDVVTASLPLGLRSTSGRGFTITNAPLSQASVFDLIDFRGELPNGNDVELYRNNTLIGSTGTPVNGRYEFLQVPVEFGLNVFRLVFYGPQGQRREEVRRIRVGDGRIEKGKLIYAIGAVQKDVTLIDARLPNFFPAEEYGNWRTTLQLQYGLTSGLTTTAGAAWYESDAGERQLVTAGLLTGIGGMAVKLDAAIERGTGQGNGSGSAIQIGVGGKLLGASYTLTHAEYGGAFSDEVRSYTNDYLRHATELYVNTTLRIGGIGGPSGLTVPVVGRLRQIGYADGHTETYGSLSTSAIMRGAILSSSLEYATTAIPSQFTVRGLNGRFDLATMSRARTQYRASLDYNIVPDARLSGVALEVDHALNLRTSIRARIAQSLYSSQTSLGLSAARQFSRFTLGFTSTYNLQLHTYDIGLRLGFSLGRDPLSGRAFMAPPGLATNGAVAVRAYDDANGNGLYDAGEQVLPGVEFSTGTQVGKTGTRGTVLMTSLAEGSRVSLQMNPDSLPDIDTAASVGGIEIVPRAGRVHIANFGVVALGQISGTANFEDQDEGARGVSGLSLVLIDIHTNTVIARTRTLMDGYYVFEQVKPGQYRINLDDGQASQLGIFVKEPEILDIGVSRTAVQHSIIVRRTIG